MMKFKKIISSFLAIGLILSCLQSVTFAGVTPISGVTWKETADSTGLQLPENFVYNSADGTFGTDGRTFTANSTSENSTWHRYYLGVELSEKVETGTVIV